MFCVVEFEKYIVAKKKKRPSEYMYRVIKNLCATDDYNIESYKLCSNYPTLVSSHLLRCQGDTTLTLTPPVIPNSNYVIIVSD
jgi:hypothetical protein